MEEEYNFAEVEQRTQSFWEKNQSFKVKENLSKEKFYCLCMFPYPSGQLHMGHVRNYTIGDVIARYQRMQGKQVLHPMGWDAFGLPAENAALKHQISPAAWTNQNIDQMRTQFNRLGFAYDWSREFKTCDPDYYRWEQWLFTRLYRKGLAYKKNATVNWDPIDQTVLANEQVVDGRGWRSGALVERREISQWFIKITNYADELLRGLDQLEGWPQQVKLMQKNWIGYSKGVSVHFKVVNSKQSLKVYTTRPDTLMGVTYLAIAAEHPLAKQQAANNLQLQSFIEECTQTQISEAALATMEKKGMDTGLQALHPLTREPIPIWVANFVLMDYGSGAVMSVPAHDQRDFEFAKIYGLTVKAVIQPPQSETWDFNKAPYTEPGILVNSGEFDQLGSAQACDVIAQQLESQGKGEQQTHYRLRDWGISRQRYWGTPIPMINCPDCGTVPVPDNQLPVRLPEDVTLTEPGSPLSSIPEFFNTTCPQCGHDATRETDTFDTFIDSSWYYARYTCPDQHKNMLDDRANYWTPVDQYVGGIEHAVMHLLYARFFHKILRDEKLVNSDEPFLNLLTQGMVLKSGAKMSKSKGNVVAPLPLIEKYGADTMRLFIIFAAPPDQSLEWSDSAVEGCHRFLKRLWQFAAIQQSNISQLNKKDERTHYSWNTTPSETKKHRNTIHQILSQANGDIQRLQLNTVVSAAMKLLNYLQKISPETPAYTYLIYEGMTFLLCILAPITPHICHVLWNELEYDDSVIDAKWPRANSEALKISEVEWVIQINGKKRANLITIPDADEVTLLQLAKQNEKVKQQLSSLTIRKCIRVPGKLFNIVAN